MIVHGKDLKENDRVIFKNLNGETAFICKVAVVDNYARYLLREGTRVAYNVQLMELYDVIEEGDNNVCKD